MKSYARRSEQFYVIGPILLVFFFALILRLIGVDWHGASADENPAAAAKVLTGQLTAEQQFYPPLLNYLIAVAYAIFYALGRAIGWWGSTAEFREFYFADKIPFLIVGRLVTALLSATAAPLALLLALEHKLARRDALIAGLLVALMPGAIYWAHIAKSDSALGPSFLLILLTGFRLLDRIDSRTRAIFLGAALALAVSFKQSAIFFILPIVLIFVARSFWRHRQRPVRKTLRAWMIVAASSIIIWIPLNIGILLDVRGFVAAQVIQSQMSVRPTTLVATAINWLASITSVSTGIPQFVLWLWLPTVVIAAIATTSTDTRFRIAATGMATIVGMVQIAMIAGSRQLPYLYLPYTTLMTASLAVAGLLLAQGAKHRVRITVLVVLAIVAAMFAVRSSAILRQALAPPIARETAEAIARIAPPGTRILSDMRFDRFLQISSTGGEEDRARHERLAKKYGIVLPPVAVESTRRALGGYIVRSYPWVMGGLESVDPAKMKVVIAYAWPLQPEEWELDYWRSRGFELFVVEDMRLFDDPVPAHRNFFRSLRSRCRIVARIAGARPMFGEHEGIIYRCDRINTNAVKAGHG